EVYVERMEDRNGQAVLSRDKARREEAWGVLEASFEKQERVTGMIFGKVKGGFTVDLSGATAFLPGSQVDIRPVRDLGPLMGTPQPFQILKIDRRRGNIVVSRRAVLEESRAEARTELVSNLQEGQVLQGVVKNITDYGAFVDLGGVDGLLHVTDIAWQRISHPSEALQIGETVEVQVIRFNAETQRISLGMKQLLSDPWENVEGKFPIGAKMEGRVTNITDYGAFVELEAGVEGLVHVSEMSWTKKNVHPGKIVSTSQQVEVMVLDVDLSKRRISLGLKQCTNNPWEDLSATYPVGTEINGEIRNITEFGLFVGLNDDIDGLVHLSDISWENAGEEALEGFTKGDMVKAKVLDIDVDKERISLGIKQLTDDPFAGQADAYRKGEVVTCTVNAVTDNGIDVTIGENMTGFIRRTDLSRDRAEQRADRFAVGEKVDAVVTSVDKKTRKLSLSIKARESAEEKKAMAEFGSSDSGASLGDILGAALAKKETTDEK
ncbi:MAG: 30S ribosomal protein S1, partial [Candidatus Puniceispirillaceae bacterium]